ncbi:ribosome recycling factor [Nitzschia inconspicua]|uniref:Ribosome recycling factor n=1 Tax=Nitzschia inconspicua TaxID=303405 RepID=A0A9K3M463_9STRA|nr:ribosome recycling factor [Nitzschia inconspicua]
MTTEKLLEHYQKKVEHYQKKDELSKKQKALLQQKNDLENGFLKGEYYASTSEVWQVEEVIREGNEWQSFVRSLTDKEIFNFRDHKENDDKEVDLHPYKRRYHKEKKDQDKKDQERKDQDKKDQEVILDPYSATKNGAGNPHCAVPNSDTAVSSSYPQSDTTARDTVWPKDIFGNQIEGQEIAHLVPAGKAVSHKQWLNVAAAVLGIPSTATLDVKKKAARGFIPEKKKHAGGTYSDSKVKKRGKMPGTGLIHFVTNKIRFDKQKTRLDGKKPTVLIVPVMTLDDAKNWKGEGYSAICLAGYPSGSPFGVIDASNIYTDITLGSKSLLDDDHPRDAKPEEVNIACDFLRTAILALHDMIANLSQDELTLGKNSNHKANTLQQASEEARHLLCKVPGPVTPLGEKPACLLTFGGHEDVDMHPAPDPLLLVLKSANVFGIMAGMKMLDNGSSDDDSDISMGDIIEEEAFLEARERALRPQTWEDLARGLVSATRLQHHQQQQQQQYQLRYKHSGRMGHKLDKLEELAHRPEREAAEERRQKKKERKAAKKNKKGGGHGDLDEEGDDKSSVVSAVMDGHDDHDDWWLDDGNDDDDNNNNSDDGDAAAQPSLPDPNQVKARMMAVVTRFQESLKTISGAKPSPEMFDDVQVNAYGSMTPLKAVGQVVITSPTLAQITCFDPSMAKDVQKAVQLTLELNPQLEENGGLLRVPLPRLSMEVREQNAKKLQKTAESCKQRIRHVRRKAMDIVKRGKDGKLDGISKDDAFTNGKEIDAVTEAVMDTLKTIVDDKMKSIMEV